ncbi:MAG: zinc ribbon domain-containing protein [bacterium]
MKKQIELLRELEELDLMLKDLSSPQYKKIGFKTSKQSLDIMHIIENRRQKLKKKIDPKLLAEYERIVKRYGARVLVQAVKEFCGGCYVKLPAEFATRRTSELLICPNCGRFLYWVS